MQHHCCCQCHPRCCRHSVVVIVVIVVVVVVLVVVVAVTVVVIVVIVVVVVFVVVVVVLVVVIIVRSREDLITKLFSLPTKIAKPFQICFRITRREIGIPLKDAVFNLTEALLLSRSLGLGNAGT